MSKHLTFLRGKSSVDDSWPLSIVIFFQGKFSTGVGACQNISPCLKLNRPWLVIVYCDIHSGHI